MADHTYTRDTFFKDGRPAHTETLTLSDVEVTMRAGKGGRLGFLTLVNNWNVVAARWCRNPASSGFYIYTAHPEA